MISLYIIICISTLICQLYSLHEYKINMLLKFFQCIVQPDHLTEFIILLNISFDKFQTAYIKILLTLEQIRQFLYLYLFYIKRGKKNGQICELDTRIKAN